MVWFKRFPTPILLPDGGKLLTLQDAADVIAALPKAERDAPEWQLAMETLEIAAGRGGEVTLAWEAVHRALNKGALRPTPEPPAPKPRPRIVR
jgi:hypothetical protein